MCLNGSCNSLWVDTSHSFHTTPGCSAPDRCFSSRSQQSRILLLFFLSSQSERSTFSTVNYYFLLLIGHRLSIHLSFRAKLEEHDSGTSQPINSERVCWTHLENSVPGSAWWTAARGRSGPSPCHSDTGCCSQLHIRIVFRWRTHQKNPENCINASDTSVIIFTPSLNCTENTCGLCFVFLWAALTCCWLPCRPVGPPAPASPGGAEWGWSDSNSGLSDRVWPSPFARLSPRGLDPALRLLGWYETLGGSYWPWGVAEVGLGNLHDTINVSRMFRGTWTNSYLTWISSWQVQHVEEEAKLTGQTKLLLAQMILH